jgi:anti-sigma factor RsiW
MNCEMMRQKMDAYVDSELPVAEAVEFEAHLRSCAACANAALEQTRLKLATRAAGMRFEPTAEFRLRMEQSLRAKAAKPIVRRLRWVVAMPVAMAAALLLAALLLFNMQQRRATYAELTDLHVTTLASANPVDVISEDRHTVKPWFAGRIPFTFNLPELKDTGFALSGGRVVYLQHSSGAQLLYTLRKHRLSVFIFQDGQAWPKWMNGASSELSFHMESWSQDGLRYVIVGDVSDADIHALTELLRKVAR